MKILNNVYDELKKEKNLQGKTFEDIYSSLELPVDDFAIKNNVYSGIHFDHRFIMVGDGTWSLREFFTIQEIEDFRTSTMHQSENE